MINHKGIYKRDFISVDDTVNRMFRILKEHSDSPELDFFKGKPLNEIFNFIAKEVRYLADPMNVSYLKGGNIELLRSPEITKTEMAGDCDDKHILAGAIFYAAKIPIKICIMSNREDKKFHHVYLHVYIGGQWKPFDATYPDNKLFEEKPFTKRRIYEDLADGVKITSEKEFDKPTLLGSFTSFVSNDARRTPFGRKNIPAKGSFMMAKDIMRNMGNKLNRFYEAYPDARAWVEANPGEVFPDDLQKLYNEFQ